MLKVKNSKEMPITESSDLHVEELRKILLSILSSIQAEAYIDSYSTGLNKKQIRESLVSNWNIMDFEEAKSVIDWLITGGQNMLFEEIKHVFVKSLESSRAMTEFRKLTRNFDYQHKFYKYYENVHIFQANYPELSFSQKDFEKGIKAWDLSRGVFVARMCYDIHYLDKIQFENILNMAQNQARATYTSWDEYFKGYLLGRIMYSYDTGVKSQLELLGELKYNPQSPINEISW
ncbi:MAG: DUF1266 domain-containing protein [Cytophagales bacterium]